ncbi:MAG: DNA polymerase III subunit delta, partial [Treponema sp.]|nr:DNA polymerase III subunit delta [Treponema sp.]
MAEAEVYLFTGPEAGDKKEAIETIRARAEKANGQLDYYSYYASETRIPDIVAQLQNESLFSSATFIVLKNAELVKGKDAELLASWCKNAAESPNTLILVSDENSVDKKIDSAVPSQHKKMFWEMFENRKSQWVQSYFRKNGFGITDEAVEQILDMVENNTDALKTECSRFFYCMPQGSTVT